IEIAEEFFEVHARREGIAGAGQHHDADALVDLQRIEHAHHLVVECRAHGVALGRTVEGDPRNAGVELHENIGQRRLKSERLLRSSQRTSLPRELEPMGATIKYSAWLIN